jgi:hypothetical protein
MIQKLHGVCRSLYNFDRLFVSQAQSELQPEAEETERLLDERFAVGQRAAEADLSVEVSDDHVRPSAGAASVASSTSTSRAEVDISTRDREPGDSISGIVSTENAIERLSHPGRCQQYTIGGSVCFWALSAFICWAGDDGLVKDWTCASERLTETTAGSLTGSSSDLVADGVEEADALLHETRMVMFWFTFGWPMLMMYWFCVSIAAIVHKSHKAADDMIPPQLLVGGCIGLLLMAYFIYAIFLWVHLMFTVFGEVGAMCAAADGEEVRRGTRLVPSCVA